jgi:non-ribosomal peptide synthetase component F
MFNISSIDSSISDLFRHRVACGGERIAVLTDNERLTYAELDAASNRVANAILEVRGSIEEAVLLFLDQGLSSVISTLGVLKAGKFYVPVDPTLPDLYLRNIVEDCGATTAICSNGTKDVALRVCSAKTTSLVFENLSNASANDVSNVSLSPAARAYIYFTSGSTGRPKGVVDSHRNVLHNIMRYTNTLRIDACDRLSLIQAPSFSGTVSSLFSALLNGATILPYDIKSNGLTGLDRWIRRQRSEEHTSELQSH